MIATRYVPEGDLKCLFLAMQASDAAEVTRLLRTVKYSTSVLTACLPSAILMKKAGIVRVFLEEGVNPNTRDGGRRSTSPFGYFTQTPSGCHPIEIAVDANCPEILDLLLEQECIDVNASRGLGCPLFRAIISNNVHAVGSLLDHPKIDIDSGPYRETALHVAATHCHFAFRLLLDHRDVMPLVRRKNSEGDTAFRIVYSIDSSLVSDWVKKRFFCINSALWGLEMPLLQMILICEWDAVQNSYTEYLPRLFVLWEWGKLIRRAPTLMRNAKAGLPLRKKKAVGNSKLRE